jgi:hypothetical protein
MNAIERLPQLYGSNRCAKAILDEFASGEPGWTGRSKTGAAWGLTRIASA